MKISCIKENIRNAVARAERFTGKNLALPVLANILFDAKAKRCMVVATNLEMGFREYISCKVSDEGSVSLPAKVLNGVLQNIDDENILFEEKNSVVTISSDSSHFSINGLSPKDFPILPTIKRGIETSLPAGALKSALGQVLPSVSLSDIKPELAGVYISCDGTLVKVAATDSFRLAERTIHLKEEKKAPFSFILPRRTAEELMRCVSEDGDINIVFGDNQVSFETGEIYIVSRLIDGTYPDYQAIIPKHFSSYIHIGKEELMNAIRSASVVSSRLNDVTLQFNEDKLEVIAVNPEVGKTSITRKAKVQSIGKISFNFRYLLDGIGSIAGEKVSIGLQNENSAVLIQGADDQSFVYVLMPIRNL